MQRAEGAALLVHTYYGHSNLWGGQDKPYQGRTQLYPEGLHNGNASLRLRAVRFQDEGSYVCYVTSELGCSSQEISLAVLRESETEHPIVTHPGQDVTLSCHFECGLKLQLLTITWKKEAAEGQELLVHSYDNGVDKLQRQDASYKDRTQLHPEGFPRGNASLTLRRVGTQDAGVYLCHVKPELGRFSVRVQVIVEDSGSGSSPLIVFSGIFPLVLITLIIAIIICKHRPSLLQNFRTRQFGFRQTKQASRDQLESSLLASGQPKEHEQQGSAAIDVDREAPALLPDGKIAELKDAAARRDPPELASALQRVSEPVKGQRFHVAVIGETGSGKSSFVNALRGLEEQDTGAAESGVLEGRVEPKDYPHPRYPNVTLWDLPGLGSVNCPTETFLKQLHCTQYNLFVVVSADRFTGTDASLVQRLRTLGKPFYFVRSKVDADMKSAQRKNCTEETALGRIRHDCMLQLGEKTGIFLISSWDPTKFDFPRLQQTLAEAFRRHQVCA
ncbi:uncharacterized protein LOC142003589 isoform X2 [Carettochelys insculpta]